MMENDMNKQNKISGIAAILLAVLFPIYWSSIFFVDSFNGDALSFIKADMMSFSGYDLLFIVIGTLEVFIYLRLAQTLKEQTNLNSARLLLMVMVFATALFHGTVLFDVWLHFASASMSAAAIDNMTSVGLFIAVLALAVATIAALVCSVLLLINREQVTSLLKVFGIFLLIVSLFQITVLFSVINILLFPCTLILLAMYFFKDPEALEVI
jgi:hypothetical protein